MWNVKPKIFPTFCQKQLSRFLAKSDLLITPTKNKTKNKVNVSKLLLATARRRLYLCCAAIKDSLGSRDKKD